MTFTHNTEPNMPDKTYPGISNEYAIFQKIEVVRVKPTYPSGFSENPTVCDIDDVTHDELDSDLVYALTVDIRTFIHCL